MKTYFYKRQNGILVRIEAEQMFWSGAACVFVKNGMTLAVIALLPGEIICEEGVDKEVQNFASMQKVQ